MNTSRGLAQLRPGQAYPSKVLQQRRLGVYFVQDDTRAVQVEAECVVKGGRQRPRGFRVIPLWGDGDRCHCHLVLSFSKIHQKLGLEVCEAVLRKR